MTKKFLASLLFFTITNLLQILVKNPISLILVLQNSVFSSSTISITDQYLANIEFTKYDIKRITCQLDPNKAHGQDMITIRMLKMFGNAIIEPLFKKFKNCLKSLKKVANKISKTITQSLFVQSVVRFWNVSKTVTC